MEGDKSIIVTEKEVGNDSGTSPPQSEQDIKTGIDININSDTTASKSVQQEGAQRGICIDDIGQQQPVCKNCSAKDDRIMELEEVIRAHTFIKSAEELMQRSTDGYQPVELSVPFEPLRRHMVYSNGINGPLQDSVWFNGKFNYKTGNVVDVRIGKITDTDTTDASRMTP